MSNSPEITTGTTARPNSKGIRAGLKRLSLAWRKPGGSREETWGLHGLNLLYDPPGPLADLIFVHGLRGGSIKTWCKGDDLKLFWPQAWLPREQGLRHVRIHSFGYNADWADIRETTLDLHDFGRALLAEMNTSPSLRGNEVFDKSQTHRQHR